MLKLSDRYDLWCVAYKTYDYIREYGIVPARIIRRNLTYEQGLQLLNEHPFNRHWFCIKPSV